MKVRSSVFTVSLLCAVALSACSTVGIPDVDFSKLPGFADEIRSNKNYPKVSDAPRPPENLRSRQDWDIAAKDLLEEREGYQTPELEGGVSSPEAVNADIEALKAKVHAYKLDDPQ